MRYLTLTEVVDLHRLAIQQSGGADGVRDMAALDSAVVQPQMSFGGVELYPTIADKAAALAFALVMNHPFVDGNKRVGVVAMDAFLVLNGHEIIASVEEQEQVFLQLAAGTLSRADFTEWVRSHIRALE